MRRTGRSIALLGILVGCHGDNGARPDASPEASGDGAGDAATHVAFDGGSGLAPVIVSPPDGTELHARRQTFAWTDVGGSYRLTIGTTPGAADIYESTPLGGLTRVTVDNLPLSGETIYAQLLSGPEGARTVSTNTYRAPRRRGLGVVVDFADHRLEDWTGPGMRTLDDVTTQLEEMEAHWEFLSRGLEDMEWDVVRIQLAESLTDDAFSGSPELSEEVVRLTLQIVDLADYDVDTDGVVDALWAIIAIGAADPPYVIGGSSRHPRANIFVDGQSSSSVVAGATGNFNRELGHAVGLPELCGQYDTIGDLSVMASSRPLPPNDFSAVERVRLGWVNPLVIETTMRDVVVPSAYDHRFAIRIPTQRAEEYFLLEYRDRPESGYGSAGFDYDGIAVYHVLEGSNQRVDPPRLKLEPADGITAEGYLPEPDDLASPDNPDLRDPWVLRSYFGSGAVFQLENVRRSEDAIVMDVIMLVPEPGPMMSPIVNPIPNPSMEAGPDGWVAGGFMPAHARFLWDEIGARGSSHSLAIATAIENDVELATRVTGLIPDRGHQLCGFLRGQYVTGGAGATLSISGAFEHTGSLHGTFDWTRRCVVVVSPDGELAPACRLGGFGARTRGTMWCDEVSLIQLDSAFAELP